MVADYALILIGLAAHSAGLAPKVCKDKVSLAWLALRLLNLPQFLKPRLIKRALLKYSCHSLTKVGRSQFCIDFGKFAGAALFEYS